MTKPKYIERDLAGLMEKEQCTKYAVNSANELEIDSDTAHKKSKKSKKKKSRRTHEKSSSSRSRSNSLRRQSSSSGHGCADAAAIIHPAASSQKYHNPTSDNNIVEYSDVSSTDFSDPEAGEINSEASVDKSVEKLLGCINASKKRQHVAINKNNTKPATLKPEVRSDINISSDEENYR